MNHQSDWKIKENKTSYSISPVRNILVLFYVTTVQESQYYKLISVKPNEFTDADGSAGHMGCLYVTLSVCKLMYCN